MEKRFLWNPDESTMLKLINKDYYIAFKAFRTSSQGYVRKKYVREFVKDKFNNSCAYCGDKNNLQIDHIKSVHECYKSGNIHHCNTINNLQLLCAKCNIKKSNK